MSGGGGKHQPAVRCRGPCLAAPARRNSKIRSGTFDHIAHADILLVQKLGKSHRARFRVRFVCRLHGVDSHRYRLASVWYAVHASSSGGTTVTRRTVAWVTSWFTSWPVAEGNIDHSSAIVPVTKGAATLFPL